MTGARVHWFVRRLFGEQTEDIMQVYITSADGSMYVHELRGAVFVTWVAKQHKEKALPFPADKAADWVKLISEMTRVECVATSPKRPGQL